MSDTSTKVAVGTVLAIGLVTVIGFVSGMIDGKKKQDEAGTPVTGGARHTSRKHRVRRAKNRTRRA